MNKEIERATSGSNSSGQATFNGLLSEVKAYEKTKARHGDLEKLYQALLNIAPTLVSSERAFSVSSAFVTNTQEHINRQNHQ